MRAHDVFFLGALFFLLGVLAASMGLSMWPWVLGGIAMALLARWRHGRGWKFTRWNQNGWLMVAALLFFMPVGAFYYTVDDARFTRVPLPEGEKTFNAEVVSLPITREGVQELIFQIENPKLRVLAKLPPYPAFSYGARVMFSGSIEKPLSDSYREYLAKERVRGIVAYPNIVAHEVGTFSLRGVLYALREEIVGAFRNTLPAKEAALMAGIAVGAREDFSEEFRNAMAESGTTHLVALSGYNIMVVVTVAMTLFLTFFSRRLAFFATLGVVCAFVLMTGAEASVVRAAVMGGVALLARFMGQRMDVRNAILFAALIMVFVNPKVLVFDLGFQLSFLALIGIVYLKPAFDRILGWENKSEIFSWRENLTTTAAAQCAVAPLLIHTFGSVSISSLAANVLILEVVPLTMGLGFILAALSFVSIFLAQIVAFFAFIFLKFQTFMIELFAALAFPIGAALSALAVTCYYGVLVLVIYLAKQRTNTPRYA